MKNSNQIKAVSLFLLICFLFCSCNRKELNNKIINNQIGEYIRKNCQINKPCKIQLKDVTDFSWDKLFVFDMAVESDVISKTLGTEYSSSSPYYSYKWFFVKNNQIVRSEEHIIYEIDKPMSAGDVSFVIKDSQKKFRIFDNAVVFDLERHNFHDSEIYSLDCANCK